MAAMVVLGREELPDTRSLTAALGDLTILHAEDRAGVMSFLLENVQIHCGLIAAPIPTELRPMLATSPFWQNDDASILGHQAHLIVAASGDQEKKSLALILTKAISAILRCCASAIAVYWGAGSVVTQKDIFCDFADGATVEQLPLYLWIDFRCFSRGDGCALFTQGLKSLDLMEIEIPRSSISAEDTVGLAFNIAHYVLDHGKIIKHGDTIGMSAHQKLRITHAPSAYDRDETVYCLELG
jgi:hypothetical protein